MKKILLFMSSLLLQTNTYAADVNSIAYEDSFVRYIAGRLTTETVKELNLATTTDEYGYQTIGDLQIIYWKKLISCDGPLPEIATKLLYLDVNGKTKPETYQQVLYLLGSSDYRFWPIVEKWERRVHSEVLKTLLSMEANGAKPPCVINGYIPPLLN